MRRIIFVDDEPNVLEGLRNLLRPYRKVWEMVFVGGGEEALAELEQASFDVIVSDMRMPKIDGAQLLRTVQEKYPKMVRIILSGHTEFEALIRSVPIAHQFLPKPCDPDLLKDILERACNLQDLLSNDAIKRIVGEITGLPSPPSLYLTLSQAITNPKTGINDIVAIVEQDMAVSAKILQVVNSAYFAPARPITEVNRAVQYLGMNMVTNLVLSFEAFNSFGGKKVKNAPALEALQQHSTLVASLARKMAPDKKMGENAYMAAMLHDIGRLVQINFLPDQIAVASKEADKLGVPVHIVERDMFGFSHAEIGAYLLGMWGLPYPIVEAVAHHHAPNLVQHNTFDVMDAVYVADHLAYEFAPPSVALVNDQHGTIDESHLEALGVLDKLPEWRSLASSLAPAAV
jgi:putative nucleotidyltransferase with HDIG domain